MLLLGPRGALIRGNILTDEMPSELVFCLVSLPVYLPVKRKKNRRSSVTARFNVQPIYHLRRPTIGSTNSFNSVIGQQDGGPYQPTEELISHLPQPTAALIKPRLRFKPGKQEKQMYPTALPFSRPRQEGGY